MPKNILTGLRSRASMKPRPGQRKKRLLRRWRKPMTDIKSWMSEYILAEEVNPNTFVFFKTPPDLIKGDYGQQLDAHVDFNGEIRKLTINKGNAKRLST